MKTIRKRIKERRQKKYDKIRKILADEFAYLPYKCLEDGYHFPYSHITDRDKS